MSIEQHAEAAVRYFNENKPPDRSSESAINTAAVAIIARHMQAAIDEATAPLKARIEALEGLGPMIRRALASQSYVEQLGIEAKITAILKGGAP